MPDNPKKHGFKFFVLCGAFDIGYDFEIYTGQEGDLRAGEDDLGASSNVVVRLTRTIPQNVNHKLFCDIYYTSLPRFRCLYAKGILAVGTIRPNRLVNLVLDNEESDEDEELVDDPLPQTSKSRQTRSSSKLRPSIKKMTLRKKSTQTSKSRQIRLSTGKITLRKKSKSLTFAVAARHKTAQRKKKGSRTTWNNKGICCYV